ncbi:queuine tRNA-ribosyltransferase catalytic subunit [Culicoides brevitarsis]|uniref:queuine tRNA-ribosyltransferase catalytic subunit n=1 Tax=Culicoides brevitarsis TaxID=469753 RepID=UPI00307BA9D8
MTQKSPLTYKIIAKCQTTKARVGIIETLHSQINSPVFMPVGTHGTLKGLLPEQLLKLDCRIMLANTYHLGLRPGIDVLKKAGGLHKFMNWPNSLLTDSGGFQMVSLLKLAEIDEHGVNFASPYDGSKCMLTPEESIRIQNAIGADIIMQLDDVVKTTSTDLERIEEAMGRTIRWLDRCIEANERNSEQSIFPIVQGGLIPDLRRKCAAELLKRETRGLAVGGLSGGESKDEFWKTVHLCTDLLAERECPRYLMGVGFASDLVVCVALGIDMFDCVFPTRTARFGCALVREGQLNLKQKKYALDTDPIDKNCKCTTCQTYSRAYLHQIVTVESVACSLLTVHNVAFQLKLMSDIREAIQNQKYPDFVKDFMATAYKDKPIPNWITDALKAVNIELP